MPRIKKFGKATSTAFTAETLVAPDENASGNAFVAATATSQSILGVIRGAVASGDSDYATAAAKRDVLIDELGVWEFTVGTGTADTNDEQGLIDLKDEDEVNVVDSDVDVVFVTDFISGTVLRGQITLWFGWNPPQMRA